MPTNPAPRRVIAERNCTLFVLFRTFFNSRFYYPVLAILFLDLGLSAMQYTLLNFAWALAIVVAEVPSGALADRIGRRPLIVGAGICMVIEMLLLAVAPRNGGMLLFAFCLANRLLSGLAEALASGADESLAYDSLAGEQRQGEWPNVLARVMHWQSAGLVVAMLVGSAVYDPRLLTLLAAKAGVALEFDQATTLRFPIYLNLLTALVVLAVALGMREPGHHDKVVAVSARQAFASVVEAGRWILRTPLALFVIVAGLLIDSVIRLLLTFSSAYFRLIEIPEASYGLIGAGMAGIGMIVSPLAHRLVRSGSVVRSFSVLAVITLLGFLGVVLDIPLWGLAFVFPLVAVFSAIAFAVSHYLNAVTDSQHRATVLSFKGLAFNLGYGFVSLLFALALRAYHDADASGAGFASALDLLPVWFALTMVVLALTFRRNRAALRTSG